jgi:hypothetical protein
MRPLLHRLPHLPSGSSAPLGASTAIRIAIPWPASRRIVVDNEFNIEPKRSLLADVEVNKRVSADEQGVRKSGTPIGLLIYD